MSEQEKSYMAVDGSMPFVVILRHLRDRVEAGRVAEDTTLAKCMRQYAEKELQGCEDLRCGLEERKRERARSPEVRGPREEEGWDAAEDPKERETVDRGVPVKRHRDESSRRPKRARIHGEPMGTEYCDTRDGRDAPLPTPRGKPATRRPRYQGRRPWKSQMVFPFRDHCVFCGEEGHTKVARSGGRVVAECPKIAPWQGRMSCDYPLCSARFSHMTAACGTLHDRCLLCCGRGHVIKNCHRGHRELRDIFEQHADASPFLVQRSVDSAFGYGPVRSTPRGGDGGRLRNRHLAMDADAAHAEALCKYWGE